MFRGVANLMHRVLLASERSRFVIRCATSASLAYGLATLVGLQHPLWAPVSALIVSQEDVTATIASIRGRFVGTLIGVSVALLVNSIGRMIALPLVLQIAIGVAICAAAAMGRPLVRVCLWTCPLVLITAASGPAPAVVALTRGSEVVLGALVGGGAHVVDEKLGSAAKPPISKTIEAGSDHTSGH
ncbi:putative membrane protein YccC [Bradyrhizobium sp. LB7.2]